MTSRISRGRSKKEVGIVGLRGGGMVNTQWSTPMLLKLGANPCNCSVVHLPHTATEQLGVYVVFEVEHVEAAV